MHKRNSLKNILFKKNIIFWWGLGGDGSLGGEYTLRGREMWEGIKNSGRGMRKVSNFWNVNK